MRRLLVQVRVLVVAAALASPATSANANATGMAPTQSSQPSYSGVVSTGGVPVPGASVVAVRGKREIAATTNENGEYRLSLPEDGVWTVRVEMRGFELLTREVTMPADGIAPAAWELALLPFASMVRDAILTRPPRPSADPDRAPAASSPAGRSAPPATPAPDPAAGGLGLLAADGFLINGSVNNGAASPFAQLRAFGNNRPGQRSLYNWSLGLVAGHSALDARPFSFANRPAPKPEYGDFHVMGTFGGPLRIPGVARPTTVFAGYQRVAEHSASTETARVPTAGERIGQLPSPVPEDQISAQARSLLALYPLPNIESDGGENYQATLLRGTTQDSVQSRAAQALDNRNQLAGTFAYQRTTIDATNLFGFENAAVTSGFDGAATWSHRWSPLLSFRVRYQLTRLVNTVTPYFAGRQNVSGDAGITGNGQDPLNWGPPSLVFANGLAGLSDVDYRSTRATTHGVGIEAFAGRGRHMLTIGGGVRWHALDVRSQQNPRGTFTFTGSAQGDPFADFLRGLPHASSIAFGTGEKQFRHSSYDAFISDDWRVSPSLTVTAGLRWEYEAPVSELAGHLVNLDIAPGFTSAGPVLATNAIGPVTSRHYAGSLLQPDKRGVQPRVGVAWRPVAGSSLVVRAGYGTYRNTSVYESIARLLAEQPPLSTTLTVETNPDAPLTLADGFVAQEGTTPNTFAVDPDFRVGYAHNWQVSTQRDMPFSLTVSATYFGTNGRRLMQEFLPNTYPAGRTLQDLVGPCLTCPAGFVYLTSGGRSNRHAGQFQLRRRLRSGLAASVQYTLARAEDNAAAFAGASVAGASIAQDWLNLEAEYGPSNFDQRHLVTVEVEYTTGMGAAGGALMDGLSGTLFKGWTVTTQLNVGSGRPLTPAILRTVTGTGITGTIRPALTGVSIDPPPGLYMNPDAYAQPAAGQWGNAGRNSATGPAQFSMNAGISRTFLLGDRLSLDWRVDATNVLNRVTYASVNTIVGSPQFGRPTLANPMRELQITARLRF